MTRSAGISYYASGFPHGQNIGKAVDKLQGNDREIVGVNKRMKDTKTTFFDCGTDRVDLDVTKGNSEWEGYNTNLKPATELIIMARKPIEKGLTIAKNCLKHGVGAINIDGCRIGTTDKINSCRHPNINGGKACGGKEYYERAEGVWNPSDKGRYPANVIFQCICDQVIPGEQGEGRTGEKGGCGGIVNTGSTPDHVGYWYNDTNPIHTNPNCPCYELDRQSGVSKSPKETKKTAMNVQPGGDGHTMSKGWKERIIQGHGDSGGASRFFKNIENDIDRFKYCPKAGKKEKNAGLDDLKNTNPCVKPIKLLEYLITMITPPGGVCLDFFMGSGSAGIAAQNCGFDYIGIELDQHYYDIAVKRIAYWKEELEKEADLNQDIFKQHD